MYLENNEMFENFFKTIDLNMNKDEKTFQKIDDKFKNAFSPNTVLQSGELLNNFVYLHI